VRSLISATELGPTNIARQIRKASFYATSVEGDLQESEVPDPGWKQLLMTAASDLLRAHLRRHDKRPPGELAHAERPAQLAAAHSANSTEDSHVRVPNGTIDQFVPIVDNSQYTFEPSIVGHPPPSDTAAALSLNEDFQSLTQTAFPNSESHEDFTWLFREASLFDLPSDDHLQLHFGDLFGDTPSVCLIYPNFSLWKYMLTML
jgi:hypothetical protein